MDDDVIVNKEEPYTAIKYWIIASKNKHSVIGFEIFQYSSDNVKLADICNTISTRNEDGQYSKKQTFQIIFHNSNEVLTCYGNLVDNRKDENRKLRNIGAGILYVSTENISSNKVLLDNYPDVYKETYVSNLLCNYNIKEIVFGGISISFGNNWLTNFTFRTMFGTLVEKTGNTNLYHLVE